jgi:hypothetical protein
MFYTRTLRSVALRGDERIEEAEEGRMTGRTEIRRIRAQIRRGGYRLNETGADPSAADWALWGALTAAYFASVTSRAEDMHTDPETVLSDLLADLMHWCDVRRTGPQLHEAVVFNSALERARDYYNEELSDELSV